MSVNGRGYLGLQLAFVGVNFLGFLACGVGLLATFPFGLLWFAVAYYSATGGFESSPMDLRPFDGQKSID
jgi:hypothetical protein